MDRGPIYQAIKQYILFLLLHNLHTILIAAIRGYPESALQPLDAYLGK